MKILLVSAVLLLTPLALAAQDPSSSPMPAQHGEHAGAADADMHKDKPPVPPSNSLNVTFEGRTITLSVSDLLNMPQTTVHVHNAHRNTDESYSGPLLADVLDKVGLHATREFEPLILHSNIVATATDHYFVLYSLAEVEPSFSTGKVIVAVMKGDLPDQEGGLIQLINTADAKPARWVHGLSNINVMSMTPAK
jgi:hypothetical protein